METQMFKLVNASLKSLLLASVALLASGQAAAAPIGTFWKTVTPEVITYGNGFLVIGAHAPGTTGGLDPALTAKISTENAPLADSCLKLALYAKSNQLTFQVFLNTDAVSVVSCSIG